MDETTKQLVKETRSAVAAEPGIPVRYDYEYERNGVCNLFMFYEAFPPSEARRLLERLEIHHTPKHGSWLNIAEIELRVLTGQCLNRRLPDKQTLERELAKWQNQRNFLQAKVDWRFSTDDARIKLKRLYPTLLT